MREPLVITGMGVISAIGLDCQQTLAALLSGQSGVGTVQHLQTELRQYPVGEVKLSTEELASRLQIAEGEPATRTALLGLWAAREALAMARLGEADLPTMPFISGTTVGGMDTTERYFADFLQNDLHTPYIAQHDCGACSEFIASHLGRFSRVVTPSTACASAANAIMAGADLLRSGQAERVLVGGSECLTRFHLNGFASLMILDEQPCRPFCNTRAGLNLGEGAAYLVIETASSARRRGVEPLALLAGYGNACDAFHPTASSPDGDGAYLAMQQALDDAGLLPQDVDYVNAHGTATPNNDQSESRAMQRLFGTSLPPVSSTKAFTGHTTSASGSIEAVFCVLAMQHQFLPLNLHFVEPMEDGIVPVLNGVPPRPLRHVLCNAFGFGGNDCSLLLASPDAVSADGMPSPDSCVALAGCDSDNAESLLDNRDIFITAAEQISIQEGLSQQWLHEPLTYDAGFHHSLEVDFKAWISRNEARRMGVLSKRALTTSLAAMRHSGVDRPDGIFCGTGLGQIVNTEAILNGLLDEGEPCQRPTNFMQSTHNTISSQVSISTHNTAPNVTYAQHGTSFDCALMDACTQLQLGRIASALVSGQDELTDGFYTLQRKAGYLGRPGQVVGETAVSLMLQNTKTEHALCRLAMVEHLYRPTALQLQDTAGKFADCDAVLYSANVNGASSMDVDALFDGKLLLTPMPIFGDGFTSYGLAVYAAAHIIAQQKYPDAMVLSGQRPENLRRILVVNNQNDVAFTFVVLETLNESRPGDLNESRPGDLNETKR